MALSFEGLFTWGPKQQMNRLRFEKELVEVQDFRKVTDRFRGINGIYLYFITKNRKDANM
jgi:hypothetical protein